MSAPSTVPEALVGAWHRRSVQFGDGPAEEHALVLWLQAESAFADLRIPFPGASGPFATIEAFAGTTDCDPATGEVSWHHEVDRTGTFAGVDHATVVWSDPDTMIETGTMVGDGVAGTYREVWARVAAGPVRSHRRHEHGVGHVQVEVGPLVLLVGRDAADVVTAALTVDGALVALVDRTGAEIVDQDALDGVLAAGRPTAVPPSPAGRP